MKRFIRKVAVLGSGVMGSRIACHYANIGCEVILLEYLKKNWMMQKEEKGASLEDKAVRNRIVNSSLQFALKSNPSPITGNHLHKEFKQETLMMIYTKSKTVIG